jgi:hypothetical protein
MFLIVASPREAGEPDEDILAFADGEPWENVLARLGDEVKRDRPACGREIRRQLVLDEAEEAISQGRFEAHRAARPAALLRAAGGSRRAWLRTNLGTNQPRGPAARVEPVRSSRRGLCVGSQVGGCGEGAPSGVGSGMK